MSEQMSSENNQIMKTKVNSSNIDEVGYDPFMSNLLVTFKNGTRYEFINVPKTEYENIINAESIGRYFIANIKGKYDFLKLG